MPIRPSVAALAAVLILAACGGGGSPATDAPASVAGVAAGPTAGLTATPFAEDTAEPTPIEAPVAEPTPEPAEEANPEPTPKPAKVVYKKLSNRSWRKVVKAPDNYEDRTYQVWACITQFDAATGLDTFRGEASNKKREYWYSDGTNSMFTGDEDRLEDFVEGDVVVIRATVVGSYSYDTQNGGNTTAPMFEVDKITRKGSCD